MIEFYWEFPCGTIIYEKIGLIDAMIGKFHMDSEDGCPLHGKDCPKRIRRVGKLKWIKKKKKK